MATPSPAPARAGLLRWIVAFVGVVLVVLGAINMAAEMKYSIAGQREPGTIVSTEGGIGRKNSVDVRAKIVPRSATPLTVELHDTLNTQHWKEGDRVEVLCTHIHADHLSCVADLWFDRYGVPVLMLGIGGIVLFGVWKLRGK